MESEKVNHFNMPASNKEADVATYEKSAKLDQLSMTESDKELENDLHDTPITAFNEGAKVNELYVIFGRWARDLHLEDEVGEPRYFAAMHEVTKKPDLILYRGSTDQDPVVGGAYFRTSRHLKLVVGPEGVDKDYVRNSGLAVEMKNPQKLHHERYIVEIPATNEAGSNWTGRLEWQRLHGKDGIKGWARCSMLNYKLVDTSSGDVLAVLLSHNKLSCKKAGKIVVRSDLDEDVQVLAVLGALGLAEKWRRRVVYYGSGVGAGGGGGS